MNAHELERELISRYVDGEVTEEERETAERLLRESPELCAYHDELKQLHGLLSVWQPAVPRAWEERVERTLVGRQAAAHAPIRRRHWTLAWSLGGASCAVAAALVIVTTSRMQATRQLAGQAADQLVAQSASQPESQPATPPAPSLADGAAEREEFGERVNVAFDRSAFALQNAGAAVTEMALYSVSGGASLQPFVPAEPWRYGGPFHTEQYDRIYESRFLAVTDNPLSTFSIDVDTASYANVRRFLQAGQLPPEDAVRIEELINYFAYDYPQPEGDAPFSITLNRGRCPWSPEHELVRIGLKGKVHEGKLPPSNLVFLIDVSGSMDEPNKLPLLKSAFRRMVDRLTTSEQVAIVVYAGAAGMVLDSTPGDQKAAIRSAIERLQADGSTAGGEGIQLAYEIARKHFITNGNNRVILATDGDFNVGVSSTAELVRLIEEERKAGVFLTVLGFGTGNYKDAMMEQLADKGNGNYYYIDTEREARKVLEEELGSVLFTIAKDVKLQIEFNPASVKAYRLIGYENRVLAKEDFNDDTKDAGELGAGHTVTALYEIVPAGSKEPTASVDDLRFQQTKVVPSDEMLVVKLRYKEPDVDTSKLLTKAISGKEAIQEPAGDFAFATAVAEFGMLLRNSELKGQASYDRVVAAATASLDQDPYGYRAEFIELVKQAKSLDSRTSSGKPGIQFKGQ